MTAFLSEMLAAANPTRLGRDVSVRHVLDQSAAGIGKRFADQPLVEARIRRTIGETYIGLGEYAKAEEQFQTAVAIHRRVHGSDHVQTLDARDALATAFYYQGRLQEATAEFAALLEVFRALPERDDQRLATSVSNLAFMRMQSRQSLEAERLFIEAIAIQENIAGVDDPVLLDMRSNLAQLYWSINRHADAEPIYKDMIERSRRVRGAEHPQTLLAMSNLATMILSQRPADALPLLEEILEIQKRVLGEAHSQTLITLNNLATALDKTGAGLEAISLVREGLEHARLAYGDTHPRTLMLIEQLGIICTKNRQFDEADERLTEYLRLTTAASGDSGTSALAARRHLADLFVAKGDIERAASLADDIVARTTVFTEGSPSRWIIDRLLLAKCHVKLGLHGKAEPILLELLRLGTDQGEAHPPALARSAAEKRPDIVEALIGLYTAWGRPEDAARWKTEFDSTQGKPTSS